MPSPRCECGLTQAQHPKGTGPVVATLNGKRIYCHKFREESHDADPADRDPAAGRPGGGRDAPAPSVGDTASCQDCGARIVHPILRCQRCTEERIAAMSALETKP